eukprot:COSAG04_NODE_4011_length_2362_cov_33.209456_1_plen_34_part_10
MLRIFACQYVSLYAVCSSIHGFWVAFQETSFLHS